MFVVDTKVREGNDNSLSVVFLIIKKYFFFLKILIPTFALKEKCINKKIAIIRIMKKYILPVITAFLLVSCNKIEEKIDQTVQKTTETVQQKTQQVVEETVKKTVNESINSLTNSEDVKFNSVFPSTGVSIVSEEKGKKINIPGRPEGYIFKYKADIAVLLPFLESQPTSDESKSDKTARKIDGQNFIDKISFISKFLPDNTFDTKILEDIKSDKNIQYYKLKRFPTSSTIIYNPKNQTIIQYVEVNK